MVQRDWQIGGADRPLRIRALRSGTVVEVIGFLEDMERAYKSLYSFDMSISRWYNARRFWRRSLGPPEAFFGLLPLDDGLAHFAAYPESILPEYRLELRRVSIQSPGFWEFIGGLNPLQQLRDYLNDRHERRKDHEYRELAEKERLRLDNELLQRQIWEKENSILREQLSIMKEIGLGDAEIQQFIWSRLGSPLSQLGRHQDSGLIEGSVND
jgi:hypothetical protein